MTQWLRKGLWVAFFVRKTGVFFSNPVYDPEVKSRRYRLDQTLIIEAGLLADGSDVHQLANLLAGYEGAAAEGFHELAAEAETDLRKWVAARRRRKWSCGSSCPPNCADPNCQFRVGC